MGVFTKLSDEDFQIICKEYGLTYISHEALASGSVNSNYKVTVTDSDKKKIDLVLLS